MEMEVFGMLSPTSSAMSSAVTGVAASEDDGDLRRGPWTVEEDMLLVDYIAKHGEGRWNSLARCAGLKRTGKSCRLRWLNYLRPDVRRGNITPEEQLLILDLHSRWGNRWSKIAQQLPGRTDNEIKNYWRTRVQKHAKQLKCDINSKQFRDVVRYIWMPRLVERIQADSAAAATGDVPATRTMSSPGARLSACRNVAPSKASHRADYSSSSEPSQTVITTSADITSTFRPAASSTGASRGAHLTLSGSATTTNAGTVDRCADEGRSVDDGVIHGDAFSGSWSELLAATGLPEFGDFDDSLWSLEDICLQQQC